jgi:N-acetylmuramoyl-L-alanine amidase
LSAVRKKQYLYGAGVCLFVGLLGCIPAESAVVVLEPLAPGVNAAIKGGRMLYIECHPPRGDAGEKFFSKYLAEPEGWKVYRNRMAVAIPYAKLNPVTKRAVMEAIFAEDYADASGWWHTVTFQGEEGVENLWVIAEWLTGSGTHHTALQQHPENRDLHSPLVPGDVVFVPRELLLEEMRKPTPGRPPAGKGAAAPPAYAGDLCYSEDKEGPYAVYRLKKGEALYTAVVARFTDYRENSDILHACEVVQKRSGIRDVRKMEAGQQIIIPMDMLADRYKPHGSEDRMAWEAVQKEADRLQTEKVHVENLDGVVVILDPGHGGRDHGAAIARAGLYEDELNYDMCCRIKKLLETQTGAKVYMTLRDPDQEYRVSDARRFRHDTDEILLTSPPYDNYDAHISANLRWYLANAIYRRETARGVSDRKIIFLSVHCDALYNVHLRGAMVYVPGAKYREDCRSFTRAIYAKYDEAKSFQTFSSTPELRRRDEALSRNFAATLLKTMATYNPPLKVHDTGDPIRNVIRQSGGRAYVPAVLRYNLVPTKVLVEAANMTNPTDQQRLADPKWRQWFAEAMVKALETHFDGK